MATSEEKPLLAPVNQPEEDSHAEDGENDDSLPEVFEEPDSDDKVEYVIFDPDLPFMDCPDAKTNPRLLIPWWSRLINFFRRCRDSKVPKLSPYPRYNLRFKNNEKIKLWISMFFVFVGCIPNLLIILKITPVDVPELPENLGFADDPKYRPALNFLKVGMILFLAQSVIALYKSIGIFFFTCHGVWLLRFRGYTKAGWTTLLRAYQIANSAELRRHRILHIRCLRHIWLWKVFIYTIVIGSTLILNISVATIAIATYLVEHDLSLMEQIPFALHAAHSIFEAIVDFIYTPNCTRPTWGRPVKLRLNKPETSVGL